VEDKGKKLNWRQACEILGCGRTKFYGLVSLGIIPGYRTGIKGVWVYEADVRQLVKKVSSANGKAALAGTRTAKHQPG
jgi:excisionase family DNA binding protein